MKQTVVPNRNAIFSSIVFGHALALYEKFTCPVEISLGVHSGDHAIYPDCRPEFYHSIYKAFQVGNWNGSQISLDLPYLSEDKGTILEDALQSCSQLHLDFDTIFRNTNTSYEPDEQGRSSGKTGADVERILAFHKIGREDPVPYQRPWSEVLAYALQVEQYKFSCHVKTSKTFVLILKIKILFDIKQVKQIKYSSHANISCFIYSYTDSEIIFVVYFTFKTWTFSSCSRCSLC